MKTKIHHAYDPPPKVKVVFPDDGLTRQSEQDSCDINKIMARYRTTGILPHDQTDAFYADVSMMGDYQDAIHQVERGQEIFGSLPSAVRARFENNVAAFLDFVSKPESREEMIELGLLKLEPETGPAPIEKKDVPDVNQVPELPSQAKPEGKKTE